LEVPDNESEDASVEYAKYTFLKHWDRAHAAMRQVLKFGDSDERAMMAATVVPCISWWIEYLRTMAEEHPAAGQAVFEAALELTRDIAALAQKTPPPPWLVMRAAHAYEVPWLVVNGKLAPGFPESDAVLRWGRATIKRGKSRFDVPQTREVARALHNIEWFRQCVQRPLRDIGAIYGDQQAEMWKNRGSRTRDLEEKVAALPPLSHGTKAQWWPLVRDLLRRGYLPSQNERASKRIILKKDTAAAQRKAFMKACQKALDGLCPP
jgi:hypothetical protein